MTVILRERGRVCAGLCCGLLALACAEESGQPAAGAAGPTPTGSTPASASSEPQPVPPAAGTMTELPMQASPPALSESAAPQPTPMVPAAQPEPTGLEPAPTTNPAPSATTPTPPVTPGPTQTMPAPTQPPVAEPEPEPPAASAGFDMSATELVAQWDLGWNLGNSLDAPEGETAWGNPEVAPGLVDAVAAAGFHVVRIPVTWSLFTGPGPDFAIDETRMNRVEEVVGYVLSNGMTAIINLHHDGADDYDGVEWITLNDASGAITEANNAAVEERFVALWTQIAGRFSDYDSRLLFESMNEIHDGYDAPDPAYYGIVNNLNQVFIDTVRGSGGNNAERFVVVPGYNTNIDYTLEGFELPNDPATEKLILSVHYYDPWSFAGEGSTPTWGAQSPGADDWGQEDFVLTQFDRLKGEYADQGVPVVIGEYGAVNTSGYEDYRRYYMEFVTAAACQRGFVPIYWDNGGLGTGPDSFGLFDRATNAVAVPAMLEAMDRGCTSGTSLDDIARP